MPAAAGADAERAGMVFFIDDLMTAIAHEPQGPFWLLPGGRGGSDA